MRNLEKKLGCVRLLSVIEKEWKNFKLVSNST